MNSKIKRSNSKHDNTTMTSTTLQPEAGMLELVPGVIYRASDRESVGASYCMRCEQLTPTFQLPKLSNKSMATAHYCQRCNAVKWKPDHFYQAASSSMNVAVVLANSDVVQPAGLLIPIFAGKAYHQRCDGWRDIELDLYDTQLEHDIRLHCFYECFVCKHERHLAVDLTKKQVKIYGEGRHALSR